MNKAVKESTRNDIRLPKHEKLNCIVRTIREWDDDDCDFFHTEQFCEELIKQYCEDEHNKCKVRSWLINCIVRTIREWDDDDCDFFHTEQFCEELIKQYCEDEHNKCKVRSWLINLIFAPIRLFQSAYDVFYNSKDKQ